MYRNRTGRLANGGPCEAMGSHKAWLEMGLGQVYGWRAKGNGASCVDIGQWTEDNGECPCVGGGPCGGVCGR